MLSVLEQIGMKSPSSTTKKTRQVTLETAFSRVNSRKTPHSSKDASLTPPSMTTGTTNTDNSSELNEESHRLNESMGSAQSSDDSFNERLLSNKSLSPQRSQYNWGSRDVSGVTTLVDAKVVSQERLLQRSVHDLNEEWDGGPMPSKEVQSATAKTSDLSRTSKTRIRAPSLRHQHILERTSTVIEKAKGVLGKRARGTIETGKDQAAALYGMTSSRLRSREAKTQIPSFEAPVSKKARLSEVDTTEESREPITQKPKAKPKKLTKAWIDHGLYVGQDRNFDARLTEAQNRKKNASKTREQKPFMPLPMYSGQKALEQGQNFRLPYGVFSPLPPGQPKPDEWKKTQKSTYIKYTNPMKY